jgi:hypothetical protein
MHSSQDCGAGFKATAGYCGLMRGGRPPMGKSFVRNATRGQMREIRASSDPLGVRLQTCCNLNASGGILGRPCFLRFGEAGPEIPRMWLSGLLRFPLYVVVMLPLFVRHVGPRRAQPVRPAGSRGRSACHRSPRSGDRNGDIEPPMVRLAAGAAEPLGPPQPCEVLPPRLDSAEFRTQDKVVG